MSYPPVRQRLMAPSLFSAVSHPHDPPEETSAGASSPESSSPTGGPGAPNGEENALKRLSGVLTRRLGTLTSTISGYADLLMDARDDRERREIAMELFEASGKINDLLSDLRHYSRSLEPAPRSVPVSGVAQGAVHLLGDVNRERVRTEVEPSADGTVRADPRLLRQALLNLLQNALEASGPAGEVRLRAVRRDSEDEAADSALAFEVWNEGEIEQDDPAVLFEPFYSTHPRRLGLGLPIAAHIAARHEGTLTLTTNSVEEGGTCFTLRL